MKGKNFLGHRATIIDKTGKSAILIRFYGKECGANSGGGTADLSVLPKLIFVI